MVRIDPLGINECQYLAVTIQLPGLTARLIYCTKGILFDECWNIDVLNHRCRVPVCIAEGRTFEEMLENPLKMISMKAQEKGIEKTMKGRQALLKMMNEN